MEDAVGVELRRIVLRYGPGICEDARRVEALLRDLSGEHRREIFVLAGAVREGVPTELMSSHGTVPATVVAERLVRTLQDNLGLGEDAARWAVETWASALAVPSTTSAPPPGDALGGLAPSVSSLSVSSASVAALSEADVADRLMALPLDEAGDVAWAVLGLLTAADGPLTMGDVAGILNLPVRQVHRSIQPIADLIVRDGRLEASGEPIRQAVTGYLGQAEQLSQQQVLVRWCAEWVRSGPPGRDVPDYVLRHGAAQFSAAADVEALSRLVDREWMRRSAARTGSLSAFISDMLRAAQAAAAQSPPDRYRELRASLAGVTAASIAAGVPPEALGVLAAAGQAERAMDLAAMVEPYSRCNGYYRIAAALRAADDVDAADAAAAEAIAVAVAYTRESGDHYALEGLAYSLNNNGTPQWASRALAALQAECPPDRNRDYLAVEVLARTGDVGGAWQAARRIDDQSSRDLAVGNIVVGALARAGRIQDAIEAAQAVQDNTWSLIGDIAAIAAERGDVAATMTVIGSVPAEHFRQWAVIKAGKVWARAGRVADISAIVQTVDDADERQRAVQEVASVLAETGQAARAVSMWKAAALPERKDYFTADLAKIAASAGDVDGALQIASAVGDDYVRRTALTHVASAVARAGDLPRATAVVRMIGNQSGEDSAFGAVAKDLAAHDRFDDAVAATGMITSPFQKAESQVAVAGSLAAAGHYPRSAALAGEAVEATTPGGAANARALVAWARALALSARPGHAIAAAERAVSAAGEASDQKLLADALATWSGALAMSGREEEASAVARRAIAAVDAEDSGSHGSDPRYWRVRRAESVATILAEAGPPEQAIAAARSLAQDYDRDEALTRVAASLARRGLADQAIDAVRASPYSASYGGKSKLEEVAKILARRGYGEGALRAAHATADLGGPSSLAEHEQARLVREVARILAENGAVEAALSAVRASRPNRNRPAAFTGVACAVALAGDVRRAAEIAETVGYAALAKTADALAESGRISEALPLAEDAIRRTLAAPPKWPATADALAQLELLATPSRADEQAEAEAGSVPDGEMTAETTAAEIMAAARQAAQKAHAIADPAERARAEAYAAVELARTRDPGLKPEAVTMAGQALQDARGIPDLNERATALGNVAMAFAVSGEPAMAADSAGECLATAAASRGFDAGDHGALMAIRVLVDVGHLTEALAGIGSLKSDMTKARALCDVAERLAKSGQTGDLLRLARDTHVMDLIAGAWGRISALAGVGLVLVQAGETGLAGRLAEEAAGLAGELTENYEQAVAHADQAELLAALGRCPEAVQQASQALAVAREPVGGWRGQVITKAVKVLVGCEQVDEAVNAAKSAPADSGAECVAAVAAALFDAGQQERATALVSDEFAAVRAAGSRSAFYDLACIQLPQHPDLFRAWLGSDVEMVQVGRELAAIEQWWA